LRTADKPESKDEQLVISDFCGIKNFNLIAVFDGHGKHGGLISRYLKEKFPVYIE